MPICESLAANPDSVSAWVELAEAWTAETGPCPEILAALPRTDASDVLGARAAVEAIARGASGGLRSRAHLALARLSAAWPCTDADEDGRVVEGSCGNLAVSAAQARLTVAYDVNREGEVGAWIHDESLRLGGACPPRGGGPVVTVAERLMVCPTYGTRAIMVADDGGVCADGSGCVGLAAEPLPAVSSDPKATVVVADEPGPGCVPPVRVELRDETGDGISDVWILRGTGACGMSAMPGSWRKGHADLLILDGASGAILLQGDVAVWDRTLTGAGTASVASVLSMTRTGVGELTLAVAESSGTDEALLAQHRAHPDLLLPGRYRYFAGAFRWME